MTTPSSKSPAPENTLENTHQENNAETTSSSDTKAPKTPSRRHSREIAFQFVYSRSQAASQFDTEFDRSHFEAFCSSFNFLSDPYAWTLVNGVRNHLTTIDAAISKVSSHWRLDRMPRVDLALLRLGAFEVGFCKDLPRNVAINEAIEMAKKFGNQETPSFINGVLDRLELQ